ncbi:MAG: phosphotransferase [Fibrobacter sp.]|nr:phosphotransferase [Fibrobacter sp.]
MIKVSNISDKRWFMGKGEKIRSIREMDSISIGGTLLAILEILFENGTRDLYTFIENENFMGKILEEAFAGGATESIFPTEKGFFNFKAACILPTKHLRTVKPFALEQSNSAFVSPGKFFFKLFRRLQAGTHPEVEIMEHLNKADFQATPRFFARCSYKADSGEVYTIGILEEHLTQVSDAWSVFNSSMDTELADELGAATARMHRALKNLDGSESHAEEVPFEKLRGLLKKAIETSDDSGTDADKRPKDLFQKVLDRLPELEKICIHQKARAESPESNSAADIFTPQRIHGDFHLGQVLVEQSNSDDTTKTTPGIKIIDFEGEPTRPLEFRRKLRSPAVDIAGMLRSFRYAAANAHSDSSAAEQAFIAGYSRISGISPNQILQAAEPYILAKAVYEACYELEFRPTWFWIPAQALL